MHTGSVAQRKRWHDVGDAIHDTMIRVRFVDAPQNEHPACDDYCRDYWTPLLGPSCMAVARFVAAHDGEWWRGDDVARCVGLKTPALARTVERLEQFHLGGLQGPIAQDVLFVVSCWPTLSVWRAMKLPEVMRHVHETMYPGTLR